jgi:hypothetical protein
MEDLPILLKRKAIAQRAIKFIEAVTAVQIVIDHFKTHRESIIWVGAGKFQYDLNAAFIDQSADIAIAWKEDYHGIYVYKAIERLTRFSIIQYEKGVILLSDSAYSVITNSPQIQQYDLLSCSTYNASEHSCEDKCNVENHINSTLEMLKEILSTSNQLDIKINKNCELSICYTPPVSPLWNEIQTDRIYIRYVIQKWLGMQMEDRNDTLIVAKSYIS